MRTALAGLVLATAVGCGGAAAGREVVPLADVPAVAMKVAKEKLPGVTFDKAWKKKDGSFEVSGKDKSGKIREIDLTADGTVIEIE
jgi:hypothetical protein